MGAHSTTQSSLGQETGGLCGAIRRLWSKSVWRDTLLHIFDTGCFTARQGLFV